MGWFDNEQQEGKPAAPAPQSPSAPPRPVASNSNPPSPAPSSEAGSTLGKNIRIDGTIVCDEDLTILGHVDGTIRGKGTLVIAKEADVRAKIDGQRVMIHGKVDGDVQGEERVVLGQTARLNGNIETPALEINEGAYFKGTVDMKSAKTEPAKAEPAKAEPAKTEPPRKPAPSPAGAKPTAGDDKSEKVATPGPSMGDAKKKEDSAAAPKQATT